MTPELAKAAIAFMQRAQLAGAEVPTFCAVLSALDEIAHHAQKEQPEEQAKNGSHERK